MRRTFGIWLGLLLASSVAAQVNAPLRPVARAEIAADVPVRPVARAVVAQTRPMARSLDQTATPSVSISTMSATVAPRAQSFDLLPFLGGRVAEAVAQPFRAVPTEPLEVVVAAPLVTEAMIATLRPVVRPYREPAPVVVVDPFTETVIRPEVAALAASQFTELAVAYAVVPPERPEGITLAAMALEEERRRGSVCGDLAIQGTTRGTVSGPGACGVENAVEVRSVAGVRLSSPAIIDCRTATRLRQWVENAAIPAFRDAGGGLASIDLMGAYSCRTRNNVAGARLSEHAFGRALDIGGFRLRDGTRVTVLRGWNSEWGQRLRRLHQAACGPFGTVLGPNANAAHRDHFHFDTARYRSGSYCR